MDVLERLNRRFGSWYEGLLGGGDNNRDLRPRDILRRIIGAMEDGRREGLDSQVYVPNVYTLQLFVDNEDERQYLRTFLDADELAAAVARSVEQHGYKVKGALVFNIEELSAPPASGERVQVLCRFDTTVAQPQPALTPNPSPNPGRGEQEPVAPNSPLSQDWERGAGGVRAGQQSPPPDDEDEPGTVPAAFGAALASLVVRGGDGRLLDAYPVSARGLRIGRGKQAGNDIVLANDAMVSKRHARVAYEDGRFVLYDENSTNGTFIDERPLSPGKGYILQSGDEVRLGETTLLFRPSDSTPAPSAYTPPPPSGYNNRPAPVRLIAGDGEVYTLASDMTVGRSLTSDLPIIGNGVASQHARLTLRDDAVYVEDWATPGGTFVNGERIPPHFPVALYDGDQVAFGEVLLRLHRGEAR
jgi:pSer/pThr/pTyr-binding forkhead associated (FHA) protein